MTRHGACRPVVYAIGPDRQDDGAQLEWDLDAQRLRSDFIFRLPEVR